jgi:hypothetical protein
LFKMPEDCDVTPEMERVNIAGNTSACDPFFMHLNFLLHLGSIRPLQDEDIGNLHQNDTVEESSAAFAREWEKELLLPKERRSFRRTLLGTSLIAFS